MVFRLLRTVTVAAAVALMAFSSAAYTPVRAAQATDSMSPYRQMATDALAAFKSGDASTAKSKSSELEKAWDGQQKELRKRAPETWKAVDDAMDVFIKPLMKKGSPDAAKVQAAYDAFIAQLDSAVGK